jgi:hypothetical protein
MTIGISFDTGGLDFKPWRSLQTYVADYHKKHKNDQKKPFLMSVIIVI